MSDGHTHAYTDKSEPTYSPASEARPVVPDTVEDLTVVTPARLAYLAGSASDLEALFHAALGNMLHEFLVQSAAVHRVVKEKAVSPARPTRRRSE